MDIDWVAPFRLAFELFMFVIGWGLVIAIASIALAFVYALVATVVKVARKNKEDEARKKIKKILG